MFRANNEIFYHQSCSERGEQACSRSLMAVTILVVATLSLFLMASTSCSLAGKLIFPMSLYGIGTALLTLQALSLVFPKRNLLPIHFDPDLKEIPQQKSEPTIEEWEEAGEELGSQLSPITTLKIDQNEELKTKRLQLRMRAHQRLSAAKKHVGGEGIDWKQFALMNNALLIEGSSFDRGHQTFNCIKAYLNYLEFLKKEGGFFTIDEISEKVDETLKTVKDAQAILAGYLLPTGGFKSGKILRVFCEGTLKQIESQLKQKGFVYFPIGYCGKGNNHGHALICKIVDRGDSIQITFLNVGEGVDSHPELDVTNTQIKYSYAYYPAVVSKKDWQNISLSFMAHLFRFTLDEPLDEKNLYRSQDLYDLLALLHPLDMQSLIDESEHFKARPQHIGDCAEKAARHVIIDFLALQKRVSGEEMAKMLLNLQLSSILLAYHSYLSKPQHDHQKLFINACEEFSTLLLRIQKSLPEEEFLIAAEMIDIMLKDIKGRIPCDIPSSSPVVFLPLSTDFPPVEFPERIDLTKFDTSQKKGEKVIPPFNPQTFKTDLVSFLANKKNMLIDDRPIIDQWPIPTWNEAQDAWNQIPQADIEVILTLFEQMRSFSFSIFNPSWMLALLTLYAAADKLMRRIDHSSVIHQSAFPFPHWCEAYLAYLVPDQEVRYLAIKSYFQNSLNAANGQIIQPPKRPPTLYDSVASKLNEALSFVNSPVFLNGKKECFFSEGAEIVFKIGCTANIIGRTDRRCDLKDIYCFSSWEDVIEQHVEKQNTFYGINTMAEWYIHFSQRALGSSNGILCAQDFPGLDEFKQVHEVRSPIPQDLMQELFLLLENPLLQVGLVMTWIEQHFEQLNHIVVQHIIEMALFRPGVLRERIKHHPSTIEELRALIDKGLDFYGEGIDHIEAATFLLQIAISLENYFAKMTQQSIHTSRLLVYEKRLDHLLSQINPNHGDKETRAYANLLLNRYYLGLFLPTHSVEDFIKIFSSFFEYDLQYGMHHRGLDHALPLIIKQHDARWREFLDKQPRQDQEQILNALCNGIIHQLVDPNYDGKWHFAEGLCRSEGYLLNFENGYILHGQTGHHLVCCMPWEQELMQFKERGVDPDSRWWMATISFNRDDPKKRRTYDGKIALDGSSVFFHYNCQWDYIKKAELQNSISYVHWAKESYKTLYFLKRPFHYFALPTQEDGSMRIFCQKGTPYLHIDLSSHRSQVVRLDEQGNRLPYRLANLEKLDPKHPIYAYTLYFAPFDQILCFVHEETEEIEELTFSHLELSFKRGDRGLESKEFPGYFLTPIDIKALKSFSRHAMILRNGEGKIKVLLIAPKEEKKIFGEKMTDEEKEKDEYLSLSVKYHVYDLDSKHAPIQPKTLAEHLFLIHFFKVQGDLNEAYLQLKKLRALSFNKDAIETLFCFFSLSNHAPLSLSFNMQLSLFFADHFHLVKEDGVKIILQSISYWYVNYLRAVGEDGVHGIPIEWRLSEEEEMRVLSFLKREKTKLPEILKIRAKLTQSTERIATAHLSPKEITLSPLPFQKLQHPSRWKHLGLLSKKEDLPFGPKKGDENLGLWIDYPNQLEPGYCRYHFERLFEQAKNVPKDQLIDPFDFVLLAAARNMDRKSIEIELISLLFYVRWSSQAFSDLSLADWRSEKISTFNTILKRAYLLERQPQFKDSLQHLMENKQEFPYQKTITLTLPPIPEERHDPLPTVAPVPYLKKPFLPFRKALFKGFLETPIVDQSPLFDLQLLGEHAEEERAIIAHFEKRQHDLSKTKKRRFILNQTQFTPVKQELKKQKQQYQKEIEECRQRILTSVNDPFNAFYGDFTLLEEREFRLRENAHQTYTITPEMIFQEAILTNSMQLFTDHRPMLHQKHIEAILFEVHHTYHLMVLSQMCEEALTLIHQLKEDPQDILVKQALLAILDYEFSLPPEHYPEVAFMKLRTGKLPRPEQATIHEWICEGLEKGENRSFQLPAGGGKTSFLVPLMILRCKRYHLVPFILSTPAMYGIEKENFNQTLSLLDEELDLLELDLHHELSLLELKRLFHQFVTILQKKKTVLITPQAYYTLRLQYFTLADDPTDKRAEILHKILTFIQKRAVLLADESHRTIDPMTQAICGLGQFMELTREEQTLLLAITKPLLGIEKHTCPNGQILSEIASSKERGQGKPSKSEIQLIQSELAKHILSSFFKKTPQEQDYQILLSFLLDKKQPEPPLDPNQCHLIRLTRYYLTTLVKRIVTMKTDYDHVLSSKQGEIDTPSYYKTPSHAQFRNHYLTYVLSIKGTWNRGLNPSQFRLLIAHLKTQDKNDRSLSLNLHQTPTHQKFESWTGLHIQEIDDPNLYTQLRKHPPTIEYYLTTLVLSKIGYPSEQFTSTPANMMDGFKCSINFSATPLPKQAHPRALTTYRYDEDFETQVLNQSAQAQNQNFIFPETMDQFFLYLSENKQTLQHVRHMIDLEGLLSHQENQEVAQKWLDTSELDGIIYFQAREESFEERLCLLLKEGIEIEYTSQTELSKARPKEAKYGIYFDAAHAESAHFDPEPNTAAILLAGDSLNLSHAIQGIMRERGFLNDEINQTIIWVIHKKLQKRLQADPKNFRSASIHTWCLINQVKSRKRAIIMAAYQDIALKIEKYCFSQKEPLTAIREHPQGFKEELTPHATWSTRKELQNTDEVLWSYAKAIYKRFNFTLPLDENAPLKEQIQKTIRSTHKRFSQIITDFQENTVSQLHQKSVIKKQVRTVQYQHNRTGIQPEPIEPHPQIDHPDYPTQKESHTQSMQALFKTPHLTRDFYIETNQLRTAHQNGISLNERFLKPIDFLLIVIHKDQVWAEAISNDLLPNYETALIEAQEAKIKHQAFMVRSTGALYQRGLGALKPDEEHLQRILESEWMKDLLIDIALLKGKILYNQRFKERISKWPKFFDFWKEILKAQGINREIPVDALFSHLSGLLEEEIIV